MKVQAITVCVNYSDFLVETLPLNKRHFDDFVVVTHPSDKETIRVCDILETKVVTTDKFYEDSAPFNKGKAINFGISQLDNPDWIVHIDTDIALPKLARSILEQIHLSEQHIYGIDRVNCVGFDAWRKYLEKPYAQHENSFHIHPGPWPTATRQMYLKGGGYVPMGYFQMFNVNADSLYDGKYYPENYATAEDSDIVFGLKWPRTHRHLLPEIVGIHLMTDDIKEGINWKGRVTRPFGA